MGPRLASWIWVKSNWNTTGLIFQSASRDRLGIDEYFWSYAWAQSEMNLRISRECLLGKNSNMGFSAQKVGCSTHWKPFTGDNAVISSARRPGPRFLSLLSTFIHPSIHPEVNFRNPPKKLHLQTQWALTPRIIQRLDGQSETGRIVFYCLAWDLRSYIAGKDAKMPPTYSSFVHLSNTSQFHESFSGSLSENCDSPFLFNEAVGRLSKVWELDL